MLALSPAGAAALSAPALGAVLFVEMAFSPVLRLCSAAVSIDWDGNTWLGAGSLGAIDQIKEQLLDLPSLKFTLSGVPSENLALALGQSARNKRCRVFFAILDPETHEVLDAPEVWGGLLDQMPMNEDGQTATIGVTAKPRGATFSRVKPITYTDADQRRLFSGDTSLRFVASQSQHQDTWPAASFFRQ